MHKKYGPDKFAAISVTLDDVNDKPVMQKAETFLKQQGATFRNYVLDEKQEVWTQKLKIDGPPCVFVFDQAGKPRKFAPEVNYDDVAAYVAELMKK
jgi:hypothetical protein